MEEVSVMCLWPGVGNSYLVSVCCNPDASWLVQIDGNHCVLYHTCREDGSLPSSHSTVTRHSLVRSMWSSDFMFLDPFKGIWLASSLQQTLMWNKLSCPGYRHMTQISTMPGCKFRCHGGTYFEPNVQQTVPSWLQTIENIVLQALVPRWGICWNVSLSSMHWCQNNVSSNRGLYLFFETFVYMSI